MAFLSTMNIIGSGMTAQQLRLDVISENITNMNTTRTQNGDGAYTRKVSVLTAVDGKNSFRRAMDLAWHHDCIAVPNRRSAELGGVRLTQIMDDTETEKPLIYDPSHPDANDEGYVEMPNVVLVKEIADAMAASQAFSANVTAFNTFKQVVAKGMEIGR